MRILSALLLTGMVAAASVASAATPPADSASAKPASATVAHKDKAASACRKQAETKHLEGLARDNFIKDCLNTKDSKDTKQQ